jgi:dihydrolipoamide dehydrogenase
VTGFVSFEGQGRSIVKLKEKGMLKVFACQDTGKILGAELFAPDGEHLAHLIAWGLAMNLTVEEMLTMPFYHPVIEEGLRTALRDARRQLEKAPQMELFRCQDTPIR